MRQTIPYLSFTSFAQTLLKPANRKGLWGRILATEGKTQLPPASELRPSALLPRRSCSSVHNVCLVEWWSLWDPELNSNTSIEDTRLSSSVTLLRKHPQRHTNMWVSVVILSSVRLVIKINHIPGSLYFQVGSSLSRVGDNVLKLSVCNCLNLFYIVPSGSSI